MSVLWLRKLHRYLGLTVGVQLLLWTIGGLYFSWNDIEEVRGEKDAVEPGGFALPDTGLASLSAVLADFMRTHADRDELTSITLRNLLGRPTYEIEYSIGAHTAFALVDALTGVLRAPLSQDEAIAIAQADFLGEAPVKTVQYITEVPAGSEYRGRDLPAYCVSFDHPKGTRIYVAAERGLVTARRNDVWRRFDLFWMLHIMDYQSRDDINTVLLRAFSVLGVFTILSGYGLWGATRGRKSNFVKASRPRQPRRNAAHRAHKGHPSSPDGPGPR